jgi:hypothetical protein
VTEHTDAHRARPDNRAMKKLTLALSLLLVAGLGWHRLRSDTPDGKLLFDRFWVDHQPRNAEDNFQVLFVATEEPFGRFVTRKFWTGQWEAFHYHVVPREEGSLDLIFGATRERQRVRYAARPCHDNGFDFCLEISGSSRGVRRYYSRKEWQSKSGELDGRILHVDDN